jgi:predicted nucleotidyltransferase
MPAAGLDRRSSSTMGFRLPIEEAELATLCSPYGVRRLSLFGSRARGTERPSSDVDLLVEFAPGAKPTLLDLASFEAELSARMGGVKVDARTAPELSRYFREAVLRGAQTQYVAV